MQLLTTGTKPTQPFGPSDSNRWIRDGWQMARREKEGVSESIELKHQTETREFSATEESLKLRGRHTLERRDELQARLDESGFNLAKHLLHMAQGKLDLAWAVGLTILSAALAAFVLLAFACGWIAMLLAFIVLATAVPIEEFFRAYEEKDAVREGIFLTLSVVGLVATYWLGSIRGLFVVAVGHVNAGPATNALRAAAVLLQYALGMLAMVTEFLCGFKWFRARSSLMSTSARAVRERDRCNHQLIGIHSAIQTLKAEPDIRRGYRLIGARQYLSCRKAAEQSAPADPNANHLRKAVIGALISCVIIALLLWLAPRAFADSPGRNIVVFCDLTKSVPEEDFRANLQAISQLLYKLGSKDRILIFGVTDGFANPVVVLDHAMPVDDGYLGLQLQATREQLSVEWEKISKGLPQRRTYKQTDVIGSLSLLQYFANLPPGSTYVFVFSDLRQCTPGLDLESVGQVPTARLLPRLKRARVIPALKGYKIYLLGVDPNGKSPAYFASLKEFWIRFFNEAGADVLAFAIDRNLPSF